jgi:hypothetical protein
LIHTIKYSAFKGLTEDCLAGDSSDMDHLGKEE